MTRAGRFQAAFPSAPSTLIDSNPDATFTLVKGLTDGPVMQVESQSPPFWVASVELVD